MKFDTWVFLENLSRKFKFYSNLKRIRDTLHEDQYTFFIIYSSFLPGMRNIWDKFCRENQNTLFIFNNFFFFRKSCILWDNVEKYCRSWQATDDNMTHAHFKLGTYDYRHTLRICNTYCFSTTKVTAQKHMNVTLYVYCLSCYFLVSRKFEICR
jgi:hypothetical protein